jgi:energy-converting hydrogenase Eha subunit E
MKRSRFIVHLLWIQGIYYALTAIWPLVHIDSFMMVTGPKQDIWLVKTVSVLILCMSLTFLYGACYNTDYRLIRLIAASAALGLMVIDVWYYLQGAIKWVYLLDAFTELVLVACWCRHKIPRSQLFRSNSQY